jgi:hypothetical protein
VPEHPNYACSHLFSPEYPGRTPQSLPFGRSSVQSYERARSPQTDAATCSQKHCLCVLCPYCRALADWDPADRGHEALATILTQSETRAQDLAPIGHVRMAASPWTYFPGAAAVMATDLASTPSSGINVQLCGDSHVLNFGLRRTPERNLSFDLRDFDETVPGPFEWDVKRLTASLWSWPETTACRKLTRDNRFRQHFADSQQAP